MRVRHRKSTERTARRPPALLVAALLAAMLLAGCGAASGLQLQGGSQRSSGRPRLLTAVSSSRCRSGGHAVALGRAAYVQRGALKLAVLARCPTRPQTLVAHGASAPVRFSPDGRWVAYGRGIAVNVARREVVKPLSTDVVEWEWLSGSDELVGVTSGGGLVASAPGGMPTRLLPDGWGVSSVATSSDGEIAVTRAAPPRFATTPPGGSGSDPGSGAGAGSGTGSGSGPGSGTGAGSGTGSGSGAGSASIWTLTLADRTPVLAYQAPPHTVDLTLARFAPGGGAVIFWVNRWGSASLAADGLPLKLVPLRGDTPPVTLSAAALVRPDSVAACGEAIAFVSGAGREETLHKRLEISAPSDGWRPRVLTSARRSTISPSCVSGANGVNGADGAIAAAAGPSRSWRHAAERRSIQLISPRAGTRLTLVKPTPGSSDESPRLIANGRWLLFIRDRFTAHGVRGGAYLVSPTQPAAKPIGPLFSLGPSGDLYGAVGWDESVAVAATAPRRRG